MTTGEAEVQPDRIKLHESREQVVSWIETGLDRESVAVYGTSTQEFLRILQQGFLPPSPIDPKLPYQTEITEGGKKNLYFFTPFRERLQKANPRLAGQVDEQFVDSTESRANTNTYKSIGRASYYAERRTAEDLLPELSPIFGEMLRDRLLRARDEGGNYENMIEEVQDERNDDVPQGDTLTIDPDLENLRQYFMDPVFKQRIEEALSRKGVLIYFNKGIFDGSKSYPGVEGPEEIMVVSDKPLDLSVISGIEFGTGVEEVDTLEAL